MSFLAVSCFLLQLIFKSDDLRQVLLFFQKDTVSFQVCILDSFLALVCKGVDGLPAFMVDLGLDH